jgi:ABC-type transport system substrate-binding protein
MLFRRPSTFLVASIALALAFSAALLLPAFPSGGANQAPKYGGVLRVKGFFTPFDTVFDPVSASHTFVVEQLFDGLVRLDSNFNIVPSLAEYWKISDGGRRMVFYLRKGVKFHHGRELTAADVKFSLERLIKKTAGGRVFPYFAGKVPGTEEFVAGTAEEVRGFKVLDDHTFEVDWTRPYVSGLYLFAMSYCKVLPRDLVDSQGGRFFQKPVGTGPFKFSSWLRSSRLDILGVRLERNMGYFGGRPYLDGIDYSPYFTDDQFDEGLVHVVPVVSERMLRRENLVLENTSLRNLYLAFSCHLAPLDRPELRRALALGIDKARLAEACSTPSSEFRVMESFIPPSLPGFYPRDTASAYDPENARMLIARLIGQDEGKELSLALLLPSPRNELTAAIGRELGRQLGLMGISLDVNYLRRPQDALDFDRPYLKLLDYRMDFPDAEDIILPLFSSGSELNRLNCRYANPRLDELLRAAEVEDGWEKRLAGFRAMEDILTADMPALPLFSEFVRIAVSPTVRGMMTPAIGFWSLDTKGIWLQK